MTHTVTKKILSGEVGVLPTDTVYGLVCVASNRDAVRRLYDTKKRAHKRGTIIMSSNEQLLALGFAKEEVEKNKPYLKPGISVVHKANNLLNTLTNGNSEIACRLVEKPKDLVKLLEKTGPLLTTSANMPGKPTAATIDDAEKYFGDSVDFYVDGGDLSGRQSSTVMEIVDGKVVVHRQGSVKVG